MEGISINDELVAVNDVDVVGKGISFCKDLISGEPGSLVRVSVRTNDGPIRMVSPFLCCGPKNKFAKPLMFVIYTDYILESCEIFTAAVAVGGGGECEYKILHKKNR